MRSPDFVCHERLAADSVLLGRSRLCEVRLINDRTWPWVLLVPAVPGIREIYELDRPRLQRLLEESCLLGQGMMEVFAGDKLNVAALGNMVPQLHLHHIVRHQGDPAWPGPVWGSQDPVPYEAPELDKVRQLLEPVLTQLL